MHLKDQQAPGLQAESDVVLQEGLGGAGSPGVDPRRLLLAVQVGVAEAGPALASVAASLARAVAASPAGIAKTIAWCTIGSF